MIKRVFLGQRLDLLAEALVNGLEEEGAALFQNKTILVPHLSLKNWLLLQIATRSRSRVAAGVRICCVEDLLYAAQFGFPKRLELQCLIYQALQVSEHPDLVSYLQKGAERRLELSQQLTSYFFGYGEFGSKDLFAGSGWQAEILKKIFVEGPFRLPFQHRLQTVPETIHCFGFDVFPFAVQSLIQGACNVNLYLFSPSVHFIEDLCTPFEKRRWVRLWEERGISSKMREELDLHIDQAPLPLSHWGRLGRELAKHLDPFESVEVYDFESETESTLQQVQQEILHYELPVQERIADGSIALFLTGSSKLNEIEQLHRNIIELSKEKKLSFSEISVLAPDIQPYVPLIEFVFSRTQLPYRIESVEIGRQSSFYQGFARLCGLSSGIWRGDEIAALIETPSFYRRLGWEPERVARYAAALDLLFVPDNDWQKGLEKRAFDHIAYFPGPLLERGSTISWEDLEALYGVLSSLHCDFISLATDVKPLSDWAILWQGLSDKYLCIDEEDAADAAFVAYFNRTLREILDAPACVASTQCSLDLFTSLLKSPLHGQIHGSHLHAVRFASLEPCVAISAEAIFLIGMDEASFPRKTLSSSLDLLYKQNRPDRPDRDRYLFLQLLFAAKRYLGISYGHLSAEDGKAVSPSHVVQELVSYVGEKGVQSRVCLPESHVLKASSLFRIEACSSLGLASSQTIALAELSSFVKHPWRYFLQKKGIDLPKQEAPSFSLERYPLMMASLEWPLEAIFAANRNEKSGIFKEAFQIDVAQRACVWQERLRQWGGPFFSLRFLETASCNEVEDVQKKRGNKWEKQPIEVDGVRIIGEVKRVLPNGYLHVGDDSFIGLLKAWPEALVASVVLGTSEIFCLKSGKTKVIANPLQSLKRLLFYFRRASSSLSPLLPDWADLYFRKGLNAFEEKKEWGDPIVEWMLLRTQVPATQSLFPDWNWTKEIFSDLISLYPARNHGDLDATV